MKTTSFFITLFMMALLLGCNAIPEPSQPPTATAILSEPELTSDKPVIKVSTGQWEPLIDENMPDGGPVTEIIHLTFAEMGQAVQVDFRPWERAYQETKTGTYFASYAWAYNAERGSEFYFSEEPVYAGAVKFLVQADSDIEFNDIQDLEGLTVCRPQQWALFTLEDMVNTGKINIERPNNMESCLRMLQAGRVDIMFDDEIAQWKLVQDTYGNTADFKALEKPLDVIDYYLIVSKGYPNGQRLLTEFDQAFDKVKQEGKIQAILSEHTQ